MASDSLIKSTLSEALTPFGSSPNAVADQLARLTMQLQQLQTVNQAAEGNPASADRIAVPAATASGTSTGGDIASALLGSLGSGVGLTGDSGGSLLSSIGSGLSLGSLISGIASLFG